MKSGGRTRWAWVSIAVGGLASAGLIPTTLTTGYA